MLKMAVVGTAALVVTASSLAYAQAPAVRSLERVTEADVAHLTDARVNVVKSALQLTPDQEKLWPAIEDAIRVGKLAPRTWQKKRLNCVTVALSKTCATAILLTS